MRPCGRNDPVQGDYQRHKGIWYRWVSEQAWVAKGQGPQCRSGRKRLRMRMHMHCMCTSSHAHAYSVRVCVTCDMYACDV